MTPIERAARTLARRSCPPGGAAQFPYVSADEWEEKNWRDHIPSARAVLEAIREPSGEMLGDVHDTLLYAAKGEELDIARTVWDRMIDAALAER